MPSCTYLNRYCPIPLCLLNSTQLQTDTLGLLRLSTGSDWTDRPGDLAHSIRWVEIWGPPRLRLRRKLRYLFSFNLARLDSSRGPQAVDAQTVLDYPGQAIPKCVDRLVSSAAIQLCCLPNCSSPNSNLTSPLLRLSGNTPTRHLHLNKCSARACFLGPIWTPQGYFVVPQFASQSSEHLRQTSGNVISLCCTKLHHKGRNINATLLKTMR